MQLEDLQLSLCLSTESNGARFQVTWCPRQGFFLEKISSPADGWCIWVGMQDGLLYKDTVQALACLLSQLPATDKPGALMLFSQIRICHNHGIQGIPSIPGIQGIQV